jgi:hypothetical protein
MNRASLATQAGVGGEIVAVVESRAGVGAGRMQQQQQPYIE